MKTTTSTSDVIEQLLDEGKSDEAKALIKEIFSKDKEELDSLGLVSLLQTHLAIQNELLEEEIESLEFVVDTLDGLAEIETSTKEKTALVKARSTIQNQ